MTFTEYTPGEHAPQLASKRKSGVIEASTVKAEDIGKMAFDPIKWIVPEVLVQGCTLLAGRPKIGKSWLSLDVALAVARGSTCLGDAECEPGAVLYLALEDNLRRLQSRIRKVTPGGCREPWPHGLEFATEWPRCDEGGLEAIRSWLQRTENARLVVVDVLAQFRSGRGDRQTLYESDYGAIKGLQELSSEFNVGILIVHHVRKGFGDTDPFERISGTLGLSGAADAALVLDRDSNGCTLYGRGRDMPEFEKAASFDSQSCRWTLQGDASEVHRSSERGRILAALEDADEPMSPRDLEAATGMSGNNLRQLLFKMAKAGEIMKTKRGSYLHCYRAGSDAPDNIGNKITSDEVEL
jgi:hypothetical protein